MLRLDDASDQVLRDLVALVDHRAAIEADVPKLRKEPLERRDRRRDGQLQPSSSRSGSRKHALASAVKSTPSKVGCDVGPARYASHRTGIAELERDLARRGRAEFAPRCLFFLASSDDDDDDDISSSAGSRSCSHLGDPSALRDAR